MTAKRISYIDMAKGIGIFLVVLGHSAFPSETVNQWISSFHMPLFFILSGILLSHTNAHEQNMKVLIQKKARTILIPYFSFSILTILFTLLLDRPNLPAYLPNALIQTFILYGISVLWFLPALFFSEVIFLFVRKHSSLPMTGLISIGICLIAVIIVNFYHYHYIIDFASLKSLAGAYLFSVVVRSGLAVFFLALGYFSHILFFQKEHRRITYVLLAFAFLFANIYLGFKNGAVDLNNMVFHDYRLYFPAAFCGSMFIICLSAALPALKPVMAAGRHSLIIMATHMNCRIFGVSYALGNVILSLLPFLGSFGYMVLVIFFMIILEAAAIYIINHFCPRLIGKTPQ